MANSSAHFEVSTPKYTFSASIHTYNNQMYKYHTIVMGGNKHDCVTITVNEPVDDRFIAMYPPDVAKLPHLSYHKDCCLLKELDSGDGTRRMIKTALKFAKMKFPNISRFELDDGSKLPCKDGTEISLAHYSIAVHGITWYERHFKAVMIADESTKKRYRERANKFLEPKPTDLPYEVVFQDFYFRHQELFEKLRHLYEKAKTYSEFVSEIAKEYRDEFCTLTRDWLEPFVISILGHDININGKWSIDYSRLNMNANVVNVENSSVSYQPALRGGMRKARRQLIATDDP
jgi:hypothetical protein